MIVLKQHIIHGLYPCVMRKNYYTDAYTHVYMMGLKVSLSCIDAIFARQDCPK